MRERTTIFRRVKGANFRLCTTERAGGSLLGPTLTHSLEPSSSNSTTTARGWQMPSDGATRSISLASFYGWWLVVRLPGFWLCLAFLVPPHCHRRHPCSFRTRLRTVLTLWCCILARMPRLRLCSRQALERPSCSSALGTACSWSQTRRLWSSSTISSAASEPTCSVS